MVCTYSECITIRETLLWRPNMLILK
jgi:hypothetical protein